MNASAEQNGKHKLVVFGREDARRKWFETYVSDSFDVKFVNWQKCRAWSENRIVSTFVVQNKNDFYKMIGGEFSEVENHSSFKPPIGWAEFIASRVRHGGKNES